MQLTYRGISYTQAPASTHTVNSGWTATYRGQCYSLPQSNAVATLPTRTMQYRGVTIGNSAPECQSVFRLFRSAAA